MPLWNMPHSCTREVCLHGRPSAPADCGEFDGRTEAALPLFLLGPLRPDQENPATAIFTHQNGQICRSFWENRISS